MINLPINMLSFLMYKMDYEMLANGLDPNAQYIGLTYEEFLVKMKESFEYFQSKGDDRLLFIYGNIPNVENMLLGYESPHTGEFFPFVFEIEGKMAVKMHPIDNFTKSHNSRTNFSL